MKIIFFEDFREQRDLVLRDICLFLGINPEFESTLRRQNPRKKARFLSVYSLLQNPQMKKLARSIVPLGVYNRIKDAIYAIFLKEEPKTSIPEDIAAIMKERTAENVIAFNEYYNRAVSTKKDLVRLWGYADYVK